MTQDLASLTCIEGTSSVASKKTSFGSLPPEITKEIFCNIDSEYLLDLRYVSKYWHKTITELLDIRKCEVKQEVIDDALNIFTSWYNGQRYFTLHEAQYSLRKIISMPILINYGQGFVCQLDSVDYMDILKKLRYHARNGGAYSEGCEDVIGSVWRTVLAITGLEYSVEELREKSFDDPFVKSFMTKYTWYKYIGCGMGFVGLDVGIIVLYPDNKKFGDLFAYDFD